MKTELKWTIEENGLTAETNVVRYRAVQYEDDTWEVFRKPTELPATPFAKFSVTGIKDLSLAEALAWAQEDFNAGVARLPEKVPLSLCGMVEQVYNLMFPSDPAPKETEAPEAPKTSGGVPKFPSTMAAAEWTRHFESVVFCRELGIAEREDLTKLFDAALSFGYEEGRKAGASRTMTASQYLACQQMNAAPPSPEAAPPRPEDPLQSFDARVWADEFMKRNNGLSEPFVSSHVQVDKDTMVGWFSNALMRGYDERRNVEAPFDEQRRQLEDYRRELVRNYRDLVARCMARIAELSEART